MTEKKALIVDDDDNIRETLGFKLQGLRHTYEEAGTIQEAREKLVANHFDYVLLDMELPMKFGGVSSRQHGAAFLEEIRRSYDSIQLPVIVITGKVDSCQETSDLYQAGANDFLVKGDAAGQRTVENAIMKCLETARKEQNDVDEPLEWLKREAHGRSNVTWTTFSSKGMYASEYLGRKTIACRILDCVYRHYRQDPVIGHKVFEDEFSEWGFDKYHHGFVNGRSHANEGPIKNHLGMLRKKLGIWISFVDGGFRFSGPVR